MVDFQSRDTRRDERIRSDDADDADDTGDTDEQTENHDDHGHDGHDDHEHNGHEHGHDDHDDHEHKHDGHDDHEHHHHDLSDVGVGIVTVSSSRTLDDDPSGDAIASAFEDGAHTVATRELVGDDYDRIQSIVDRLVSRDDVDVVVTTGGTGVTPDDVTVEAVRPLLDKDLPGFGELFRDRSYDEIGTRVVGTRALGGVSDEVPVFCLPGSENAATLGAEEIIVPEAPHLAGLARRDDADEE
ncbi:MogA/MoaB family molybdenum cofactor biosynthesis protein [Halospeciosus flavus]|uniref:Molybdenum cofactor biosynthesis protein B n=1 Tax=Halospeciosus flavus TaxID=3032283 RepID=A0ABD5Z8P7_9EURY|nr:molybdenum cofactor synthesis domain-containing protein [Halospeciosus flavus]